MDLLQSTKFKCSVSSVLNRDVKQHGKHFMFDAEEDTAWNSSQGSPQWIAIEFEEPQILNNFSLQFQGGFVGKDARIVIETQLGNKSAEDFYPEDVNSEQNFELKDAVKYTDVKKIKFIFNSSTDFFGRIIIYKLHLS